MNRSEFLKLIENAGPSDRTMVGEVNELITIFPYFQSAYILLLKGLKNTSDVRFENQLRSSAMRIADREILYYFLGKETTRLEEPAYIAQPHAVNEETVTLSDQTVIESANNSDDLISVFEKNSVQTDQEGDQNDEHKETRHSILVASGSDDEELVASVFIIDDETGISEEKVVYMDPGFSVDPFPDLLELENDRGDSYSVTEASPGQEENIENTNLKDRQLQAELIEKFIATNPRIEPVRTKPDAPVEDISKPFVEEKGGLVTETLARIYINQGYYSRAIDIYEKLSLKFPEKCSYFASQIEKVKELIKK